ncbi:MAG: serine hydrolase domain-containing protein, partial [Leptospirales bacterium]
MKNFIRTRQPGAATRMGRLFSRNFFAVCVTLIVVSGLNCAGLFNDADENAVLEDAILFNLATTCRSVDDCYMVFAGQAASFAGSSLQISKRDGTQLYARDVGNLTRRTYGPIFSASKWITAAVILAVIEDGGIASPFDLNLTTATALGWTGTKGTITMRQLLSFTSGLRENNRTSGSNACIQELPTGAGATEKNACIESIRASTADDVPGASFVYNSNHMAVAQRIAEIRTGQTWEQLFVTYIAGPAKLGFDTSQAKWYANIQTQSGDGSLAGAYGLRLTAEEYMRFNLTLLNDGVYNGTTILSSASVTALLQDQYESNTQIGYSQFAAFGYRWQYGLGNWRQCNTPSNVSLCDLEVQNHSFGANGFYPWVDRARGYAAVIGANISGGFIIPNAA